MRQSVSSVVVGAGAAVAEERGMNTAMISVFASTMGRRLSRWLGSACLVTLMVGVCTDAGATLIGRDNFDYATGEIGGQNGGSGLWTTAWTNYNNVDRSEIVTPSTPLVFKPSGANMLGGGNALWLKPGNSVKTPVQRRFPARKAGMDVYIRFLFRLDNDTWDYSDDFFMGYVDNAGDAASENHGDIANVGIWGASGGSTNFFAGRTSGGRAIPDITFTNGVTYLLVARFVSADTASAPQFDRVDMWINPDAADINSPDATIDDLTSSGYSPDRFGWRFGSNLENDEEFLVDDVAVADSWNDIMGLSTIIAGENFDYDTGEIYNTAGGSGWTNTWNTFGQPDFTEVVTPSPAVTYAGTGMLPMGGGNALQITGDNLGRVALLRNFPATTAGETVYLRYLLRRTSAGWSDTDFLSAFINETGTGPSAADHLTAPSLGVYAVHAGDADFFARLDNSANYAIPSTTFTSNTTYLLVARYSNTTGADTFDKVEVWIDPGIDDEGSPDATLSGVESSADLVDRLGWRTGSNLSSADVLLVDDVVFADSWDAAIGALIPDRGTAIVIK